MGRRIWGNHTSDIVDKAVVYVSKRVMTWACGPGQIRVLLLILLGVEMLLTEAFGGLEDPRTGLTTTRSGGNDPGGAMRGVVQTDAPGRCCRMN